MTKTLCVLSVVNGPWVANVVKLLILCSLLSGEYMQGKSPIADSLKIQFKQVEGDSLRTAIALSLAKHYRNRAPDSSTHYARLALDLSKKHGLPGQGMLAHNSMGIVAKNNSRFGEAINHYRRGLKLATSLDDKKRQASFLNNIGNVYHRWNKLDSALTCYQQSLDLKIELGDQLAIAKSYNNLGNYFASRENHDRSKAYYRQALALEEQFGTAKGIARLHLNLGNTYYQANRYDSSKYFYEAALTFHESQGNTREIASCLHNLGSIAEAKGDLPDAIDLYNRSLTYQPENTAPLMRINTLNNIGNVYKLQGKYKEAIRVLEKGKELADEANLPDRKRLLLFQFYECYELMGDFKKALSYHKAYKSLNDTIYNSEQDRTLLEIQTKYETEKREKELILARAANRQKAQELRAMIGASIFLLLLLGLGLFAYRQKQRDNKTLEAQKEVIATREQEKALLLRELHHRVKNNLQLVSSLLNIQAFRLESDEASEAVKEGQARVEAMALIHRDLYLGDNSTKVNLKVYVENMLRNLERSFRVKDLQLTLDIEDMEVNADIAIPLGLILNEIITNAFKHAFTGVESPTLSVSASRTSEQELHIQIKDNGPGPPADKPTKASFGMELIRSMTRQIKARYKTSQEDGYQHDLWVPIRSIQSKS